MMHALLAAAAYNQTVEHRGRLLESRTWGTIKSDCDLAGGSFTPYTDNCDTFFGSSSVTCRATSGCSWATRYTDCPRERSELVCQVGCSCTGGGFSGQPCRCSGSYATGSYCKGEFTGPGAEGSCTLILKENGVQAASASECKSGTFAGRVGLYFCTAPSRSDRGVGHGCDALKPCREDLMCSLDQQCQAKLVDGAGCLTDAQCKTGSRCAAPVINPLNRRCSSGGAGHICDPLGSECASGLTCFLGGFCGNTGDSEGAPCDARVPCAAGWTCNGNFQCTKMDGKIGSGCDVYNRCKEGTCSLGNKCLLPGTQVGNPCDATVPCGPGLSCDSGFRCVRDDAWVESSMMALPRDYRPQCQLSLSDSEATNYMENLRFRPDRVVAPRTAADVVAEVKAASPGRPIKPVGGCASMSPTQGTAGTMLHTYELNTIQVFDESKRLFWLGTGVSISDFINFLAARTPKLAMPNLGGWTGQTLVGAVTTGTHGSGINFPPLCDFVRAIHLVAGDGNQYIFEPATGARLKQGDYPGITLVQDDSKFRASVVTMGTLGVVVGMLYEALPYYWVAQKRIVKPWAEMKPMIPDLIAENDHVELWLNPYDGTALASLRNRIPATEFITEKDAKVVAKEGEFRTVRGFRTGWEAGMTGAAAAIQTARDADIGGRTTATSLTCQANYRAANGGKGPPAEYPHADGCVSQLLTSALEGEADYSDVVADYPYMYDTGRANSATVLCSEPSVPLADAAAMVDEYIKYANALADDGFGEGRNFYTAFASIRFSGASDHLMASAFGGPRSYIEAPAVQGLGYVPNSKSPDQLQLIDGLNSHIMNKFPEARLHFGLQNDVGWDAKIIRERFPAYSWHMFTYMAAKYDPQDITRSDYEDRILGKGKHATIVIEGTGCVRDGECVTSTNFPGTYLNDQTCKITGFENREIEFERFDVESHGKCSYDGLTINGNPYCGTTKPDGYVPTGPIEWKTDHSEVRGGWKLCPRLVKIEGTGCVRDGQCVTSKNYPSNYGNDETCKITGFEGRTIQFKSFDVEAHDSCAYDSLTISGTGHCGTTKPTVVPTGPIEWKTDHSVVQGGWKLCPAENAVAHSTTIAATSAEASVVMLGFVAVAIPIYRRRRRRKPSAAAKGASSTSASSELQALSKRHGSGKGFHVQSDDVEASESMGLESPEPGKPPSPSKSRINFAANLASVAGPPLTKAGSVRLASDSTCQLADEPDTPGNTPGMLQRASSAFPRLISDTI